MAKYLVPINDSQVSLEALDLAMEMGKKLEAELYVLSVVPAANFIDQGHTANTYNIDEMNELAKSRASKLLEAAQERMAAYPFPYSAHYKVGTVAQEIRRVADEIEADLIIMGNRGLNPLSRIFFGSISNQVINRSHTPVLVVKN